jgi:hypothetical protein
MIIIPDNFRGKPIQGSIDKVLAGASKPRNVAPQTQPAPVAVNIKNPEEYVFLPARSYGNYSYPNTAISLARVHNGKNWFDAHKALSTEGKYMPTVRQFVDFVNILKSGKAVDVSGRPINKSVTDTTLEDIFKLGNYRGRWLDADFKVVNGNLYMNYSHRVDNQGNLVPANKELLLPCLMSDRKPGIDLDDWLANANVQGLPQDNVKQGSIWYWAPMRDNKSVAGFGADSGGAVLGCGRNASFTNSSLGVHSAQKI